MVRETADYRCPGGTFTESLLLSGPAAAPSSLLLGWPGCWRLTSIPLKVAAVSVMQTPIVKVSGSLSLSLPLPLQRHGHACCHGNRVAAGNEEAAAPSVCDLLLLLLSPITFRLSREENLTF